MIPEVIECDIEEFCTNIGGIEFSITYADKNKFKENLLGFEWWFKDLETVIKSLVLEMEYMLTLLLNLEDYDEEEWLLVE